MEEQFEIRFCEMGEVDEELLKYAVIVARFGNKWVFCRHKDRDTYEIPGGRKEPGETIEACAKRELWEETGATRYSISYICIYAVMYDNTPSYGALFFADIQKFEPLGAGSEIAQISLRDVLPDKLTYPGIQPELHEKAVLWLRDRDKAM